MITNERQYKITKSQLTLFQEAISSFDLKNKTQLIGSEILALAELESLKSEVEILKNQIHEYETLRDGTKSSITTSSLSELPQVLIKARIVQNLSQKELANLLNLKEQQIQRYEAEEYHSASLKRLMEVAEALNLNISGIAKIDKNQSNQNPISREEINWERFPFKEMYKRGWFEGFIGSFDEACQEHLEILQSYFSQVFRKPSLSFQRKNIRVNSNFDEYSLLAWEGRVLHLAKKVMVEKFEEKKITPQWVSNLVKLSQNPNGPLDAKEMLEQVGIILIIEPVLPKTHLDGAAILYGSTPIIGMTLRYDRVDNFWFVLLHEIAHVSKHLGREKINRIFDDLDLSSSDNYEQEADDFALESLIPMIEWNNAIARFTRSKESCERFAKKLEISPAIVAGRIRYETNNYTILNELIGQGQVRKLFSNVIFGG